MKTITKDKECYKEGHYIMIKGSIPEEDITTVNIYAPNIGGHQYIMQMLATTEVEIDSNTVILGDFNIPLIPMEKSSRHKINKEIQALNDTLDQLDLNYIYKVCHPKTVDFIIFSSAHGTFPRTVCTWVANQTLVN